MKTFIMNNDGIVYQKDLGPNSINIVKDMELYSLAITLRTERDYEPILSA